MTAYELWDGPSPASERVFLHRDFHPGNILWTDRADNWGGRLGLRCAGPPEEDIGHCRANLAIRRGQGCADEFLAIWQDLTGKREYHPYWDMTSVVSFDHERIEPRLDEFVAAAAAKIMLVITRCSCALKTLSSSLARRRRACLARSVVQTEPRSFAAARDGAC